MEKEYRRVESLALPIDNMVMRRPLKVTKMEGKALGKTTAKRDHGASKLTQASAEERVVHQSLRSKLENEEPQMQRAHL